MENKIVVCEYSGLCQKESVLCTHKTVHMFKPSFCNLTNCHFLTSRHFPSPVVTCVVIEDQNENRKRNNQ